MTHATFGERALATLIDMLWMIPMALLLHYLLYGADAFSEALEPRCAPGLSVEATSTSIRSASTASRSAAVCTICSKR